MRQEHNLSSHLIVIAQSMNRFLSDWIPSVGLQQKPSFRVPWSCERALVLLKLGWVGNFLLKEKISAQPNRQAWTFTTGSPKKKLIRIKSGWLCSILGAVRQRFPIWMDDRWIGLLRAFSPLPYPLLSSKGRR